MKTIEEIIMDYTKGEASLEEANAELEKEGYPLTLNPARNTLTAEELAETSLGENPPATVNGYGLMDHGVGCMEKVHVVDGQTVDVNMGQERAYVHICGKVFRLRGTTLTEE